MALRLIDAHSGKRLKITRDSCQFIKRFDAAIPIKCQIGAAGQKKPSAIGSDDERILDYRDLKVSGYLSTFQNTTFKDRQNDYVQSGAFSKTIRDFMKNPVMLVDHHNSVSSIGGQFTKMIEDEKGLYVEGRVSNAPGLIDVRWKLAEGMLKTMSMGGLFHYKDNGIVGVHGTRGIERVDLFEGSLVAVPANNDAQIHTRFLNEREKKFLISPNPRFLFLQERLRKMYNNYFA